VLRVSLRLARPFRDSLNEESRRCGKVLPELNTFDTLLEAQSAARTYMRQAAEEPSATYAFPNAEVLDGEKPIFRFWLDPQMFVVQEGTMEVYLERTTFKRSDSAVPWEVAPES